MGTSLPSTSMSRRSSRCRPARPGLGADLVDRALAVGGDQGAVGAHLGAPALARAVEHGARLQQAALDQPAEGNARLLALGGVSTSSGSRGGWTLAIRSRPGGVVGLALEADPAAAQALGHGAGGAAAEEGIEHQLARAWSPARITRCSRASGFWVGVGLAALVVLQALAAGADRDQPVAAHLQVVVQRLHGLVVEGVAGVLVLGRPDQGLVGVGEAPAAEVRHGVGLAPDHVVQDPVAQVLQDRADPEDVVVAADHPERAVVLQHAARRGQPGLGEGVVGRRSSKRSQASSTPSTRRLVGPGQLARQLQVVGRVGEDHVDRGSGRPPISSTQSPTRITLLCMTPGSPLRGSGHPESRATPRQVSRD